MSDLSANNGNSPKRGRGRPRKIVSVVQDESLLAPMALDETADEDPIDVDSAPGTIRVKVLYFRTPIVVDVPGKASASSVSSSPRGMTAGNRWEIEYQPFLRHHRISFFAPGDLIPRRVVYVHESWCWWEAL